MNSTISKGENVVKRNIMRWPGFRRKAVTLSYDDGTVFDKKLIEIMDKYGLKGTFNINSGEFGSGRRLSKEDAYELYAGSPHEVAVHGVYHLALSLAPTARGVADVINDRVALEDMFGRPVCGMAYANGTYDDDAVEILRLSGIDYSRTTTATEKFDVPVDWLRMPATCHHKNPRLMELAEKFIEDEGGRNFWWSPPRLFYLWGHSYEFNDCDNWDIIEKFGEYIGNREDIWYATNGEIYDYVKAFDSLKFSANGKFVHNPSAIDVCICLKDDYLIPAGETVEVKVVY